MNYIKNQRWLKCDCEIVILFNNNDIGFRLWLSTSLAHQLRVSTKRKIVLYPVPTGLVIRHVGRCCVYFSEDSVASPVNRNARKRLCARRTFFEFFGDTTANIDNRGTRNRGTGLFVVMSPVTWRVHLHLRRPRGNDIRPGVGRPDDFLRKTTQNEREKNTTSYQLARWREFQTRHPWGGGRSENTYLQWKFLYLN